MSRHSTRRLKRVVLDVDVPSKISLIELAESILRVKGVRAVNITVEETDVEVLGLVVIVEGDDIDYDELRKTIEHLGAAIRGVDQVVAGDYIVEYPIRLARR